MPSFPAIRNFARDPFGHTWHIMCMHRICKSLLNYMCYTYSRWFKSVHCVTRGIFTYFICLWGEAMSNSEEIKLAGLAVIELWLAEGMRQSISPAVSQSVSQYGTVRYGMVRYSTVRYGTLQYSQSVSQNNYNSNIFYGKLLKEFRVDLKTCLGLVLSNQCCPIVVWDAWLLCGKFETGFWVAWFRWPRLLLCHPYY